MYTTCTLYPLLINVTANVEIPINDFLIPDDRRTRGGHNQAYKHLRANTTLWQNSRDGQYNIILAYVKRDCSAIT